MSIKIRRASKSKLPVIASKQTIREVLKFFDLFDFRVDASKALGVTFTYTYMLKNGFAMPSEKLAIKMEEISKGRVKACKLLGKNNLTNYVDT